MKLEELTQEGLDELTSQLEVEKQARSDAEALVTERDTRITGLEAAAATAAESQTRLGELEQTVTERDTEITSLKESLAQGEPLLARVNENLSLAVTAYKAALVQANPGVPASLVTGDSIEEVDRSLESAKSMVSDVRSAIEAEIKAGKVPAGSPPRTAPDLSAMSPREKLQYAVAKGGK